MKNTFTTTTGYEMVVQWMAKNGNAPFDFQQKSWKAYHEGKSGMVVAPTGFGKTFSIFLAVVIDYLNHPEAYQKGLKLLWVSPLRSLAKDLAKAMSEAILDIGLDWEVSVRNGDTPQNMRRSQERLMPDILITTPETIQLMFTQKDNSRWFKHLNCLVVDEWHELLGSKRGVLTELAVCRMLEIQPKLRIWGITATIGNLEEAAEVLLPYSQLKIQFITSKLKKKIDIQPVFPDTVELLPWAGHLGKSMATKIIPIIHKHRTTLIFTNTRGQAELWYQIILEAAPELAGLLAIHHGSIDGKLRIWIEDSIASGQLKAVICTSSLDLGVDFKPVDCVIQIGSAKGIARFVQRAGRSGHSPYETSVIYLVPTNTLELLEASALKQAYKDNHLETRTPIVLAYDVLVQYLVTLATGEGFKLKEVFNQLKQTHAYHYLTEADFAWAIQFITQGGSTLKSYEEFHKVMKDDEGIYRVKNRRISMLHRMNVGVIVSDAMLRVKFISGGYIGMIEEFFISKLKPKSAFILAGRTLELDKVKDMTVYVKSSKAKNAIAPSWMGGRLPLSSKLSSYLRLKLSEANTPNNDKELQFLNPLWNFQLSQSHIPKHDEFLVEYIQTKDGYHLFMYPFEGRLVHEVMSALIAYRLGKLKPITFTMAMNDYGFELLSDLPIPVDETVLKTLLSEDNLMEDVIGSINASEMASRAFRDIAVISGLVVQSAFGQSKTNKSLQSSSGLIFRVLEEHEAQNLLLRQAYEEVFNQQLEEARLREAIQRINKGELVFKTLTSFTPLSFPIKVDSLRESLSSEQLDKRIKRLQQQQQQWQKI
ncbi:ligase-associated DNA damage response DEXH box helicase [Paucihalobacter sp.]|uniref:ligase-associated DNA damage response DEXH box helicase n=1 Tax=Paucihalobacter sp. TaxID=2850405 RepID=UPI002FE39A1F